MNRSFNEESDTTEEEPNKKRRLSKDSHNESESETDASFEVVGERYADEDPTGDGVDLMGVLDEVDDEQREESRRGTTTETIDLEDEAAEQQVKDVPQEEREPESSPNPLLNKAVREYHCPICFEPPDTAVMTPCGHIFCVACLFQMVNSSRTNRKSGNCALCRSEVKLRDIRLVILRKARIKKS